MLPFHVQLASKRVRVVLYRRKTGAPFYARWWFKGQQHNQSTGQHTEPAARLSARMKVWQLAQITPDAGALTLGSAVTQCLAALWPTTEHQNEHYRLFKITVKAFAESADPDLNLLTLPFPDAIQKVRSFLEKLKAKGLKAQTILNRQRHISRLFSWCLSKALVPHWYANPAAKKFLELDAVYRRVKPPIDPHDMEKLMRAARKSRVWPAVLLGLSNGLRTAGVRRIKPEHINFKTCELQIHEKRRDRIVPLDKAVCRELHAWIRSHNDQEYLLELSSRRVFAAVQEIRRRQKLRPEATLQGCRRTFIDICFEKGVSAELCARMCGNSVAVIERHYKDLQTMKATHVIKIINLGKVLRKIKRDRTQNRTKVYAAK